MTPAPGPGPAFLAITGPTASGKTSLSLAVARHIGGEIISMDSRQVYRNMDIGTAKVTVAERGGVPHHGLDLVGADERYSAGRFARDARRWITEIRGRRCVPILVGGTGFFLRALMEPIFAEPPMDPEARSRLHGFLGRQPRERLERWVEALDPHRAELAVQGGPHRMIRTLEVAFLTGRPLSYWHRTAPTDGDPVPGVVVRMEIPREVLDRRIDDRVDAMVRQGLVGEVRRLLDAGFGTDAPGLSGVGYRETARHLAGECELAEAVLEIQANTRRFARRQMTWLRNQLPAETVGVDATAPLEVQVERTVRVWEAATAASQSSNEGSDG